MGTERIHEYIWHTIWRAQRRGVELPSGIWGWLLPLAQAGRLGPLSVTESYDRTSFTLRGAEPLVVDPSWRKTHGTLWVPRHTRTLSVLWEELGGVGVDPLEQVISWLAPRLVWVSGQRGAGEYGNLTPLYFPTLGPAGHQAYISTSVRREASALLRASAILPLRYQWERFGQRGFEQWLRGRMDEVAPGEWHGEAPHDFMREGRALARAILTAHNAHTAGVSQQVGQEYKRRPMRARKYGPANVD